MREPVLKSLEYESKVEKQEDVCTDLVTDIEESIAEVRWLICNNKPTPALASYSVAMVKMKALRLQIMELDRVGCGY